MGVQNYILGTGLKSLAKTSTGGEHANGFQFTKATQ
jgi:hypothetical protein